MFSRKNRTRKKVRRAVRSTKRTLNDALDRIEPRLETAAESLESYGRQGLARGRELSAESLGGLRKGYASAEKRARKMVSRRNGRQDGLKAGKLALITAGAAALLVGVLR